MGRTATRFKPIAPLAAMADGTTTPAAAAATVASEGASTWSKSASFSAPSMPWLTCRSCVKQLIAEGNTHRPRSHPAVGDSVYGGLLPYQFPDRLPFGQKRDRAALAVRQGSAVIDAERAVDGGEQIAGAE